MYVYFIKCQDDNGYIKIGMAKDVKSRLDSLQTGCPYPLKILSAIKCDNKQHAYSMEKSIHRFFKNDRIGGEWFRGDIKIKNLNQSIITGTGLIQMGIERNTSRDLISFRKKQKEISEDLISQDLDEMSIENIYSVASSHV